MSILAVNNAPESLRCWRVIPTATGMSFVLVLIVLFCLAVNYSNNLIFTLCFLLIGVLLLSAWLGIRNLQGLSAGEIKVQPAHCGQWLEYQIPVADPLGLNHFYIQLRGDGHYQHLRKGEENGWRYRFPAAHRGMRPMEPLIADSCWPLGFFRISKRLGELPEVLVYPKPNGLLPLTPNLRGTTGHNQDECEELIGNRRYQPGDNPRRINWRTLAKNRQLVVKQFDGADGDPTLWLRWEDTRKLDYEQRISCLTHWALECHQQDREFGLQLPQLDIPPARDGKQLLRCLRQLALLPEKNQRLSKVNVS